MTDITRCVACENRVLVPMDKDILSIYTDLSFSENQILTIHLNCEVFVDLCLGGVVEQVRAR